MRQKTKYLNKFHPLKQDQYDCLIDGLSNDVVLIQDSTHIGTKLRNRLLKPSICLPFGNKIISLSHLKILINNVPKDKHGLVLTDISPEDRQNFRSLEKVMEPRVNNALKKHIIDSEATVVYLDICSKVTSSFLDQKLTPIERLYRIWYSIFLLRIWREFITQSESYNVKENFISSNAYSCIEMNAFGLTQLLAKGESPELFQPYLFDSQPCERTFRQMRSMSTINWTKINFNLLELLHLIARVEIQNDIIYDKLANIIDFPRVKKLRLTIAKNYHELPTIQEVMNTIQDALNASLQCASNFGMTSELLNIIKCPLHNPIAARKNTAKNTANINHEEGDEASDEEYLDTIAHRENINLRSFDIDSLGASIGDDGILNEESKYIQLYEPDGSTKIVLKSSIVWLLTESTKKLSSDRIKRVKQTPLQKASKRQKMKSNPEDKINIDSNNVPTNVSTCLIKSKEICIGDWCFFSYNLSSILNSIPLQKDSFIENIVFGCVLSFKFIEGKTEKEKQ